MRSVETYRLEKGKYVALGTYGEDEVVRLEPFDAIELELRALWPDSRTPLPKP